MSRIKILPNEVIDQIAAGEVVERPSHMIKELVENSIDAGSTSIEVEVSDGGRFVKVIDNGSGIEPEDLPLSLSRHATSKINKSDDLWNLSSYGFRGEALASIASVSLMTITSRVAGAESASRVRCEYGKIGNIEKVGGAFGTSIVIENLFQNVPARLKFLKSAASEVGQIKNVFKALALSYPKIDFRFVHEKEIVFIYPACLGKKERASQVLGVKNLYEGFAEREGVRCHALFADPNTTAKTSKNIWLFAQSRYIQDRSLQAAVMEAYRSLLMHGEFPIVVAWIETDPEQIDVNIHPTKSQVKFLNASMAFRAVQASVRDTLEKAPWVENILEDKTRTQYQMPAIMEYSQNNLKFKDESLERTQFLKKDFSFPQIKEVEKIYQAPAASDPKEEYTKESGSLWSGLQVLGQAHLTYIIAQNNNGIIFVDQHASHERVIFEKLMKSWRSGSVEVQDYLFPLSIDLSPEQVEALEKKFSDLEKVGIYLEVLGPQTIGIKASPALVKESALPKQIEKLAHQLVEQGDSFLMDKYIGEVCSTLACHSAVRAGQALSLEQMVELLKQMDEFPLSTFCPHGRPVYVEYPIYKLEKDFGRIM